MLMSPLSHAKQITEIDHLWLQLRHQVFKGTSIEYIILSENIDLQSYDG